MLSIKKDGCDKMGIENYLKTDLSKSKDGKIERHIRFIKTKYVKIESLITEPNKEDELTSGIIELMDKDGNKLIIDWAN